MADETEDVESIPIHSNYPLLNGEDRLKLNELMELYTKLSQRVLDLENTKTSQAIEIGKLKEKVKKLERRSKSRTPGLKRLRKVSRTARIESSEDEGLGAREDASKQGRKIADLDADAEITLVDEAQEKNDDNLMFDTRVFDEQEVEVEKVVSTAEVTTASTTTTTVDELTLAQTLIEIKAAQALIEDNYYQAPKPQRSNAPSYMQSSSTRPSTPQSKSVSEEDNDQEQARRDKDMKKNLALLAKNKTEHTTPRYNKDNQLGQFGNQRMMTVAGARETVGSLVVQQNGIQCFNCKGFGHYARECRKPKRVKDYAYHKEKIMMCKQAEQGVPLQAEQADWLEDTDEEIDEQELEAHYSYMAKIQEVSPVESSSTNTPLEL
ncbi:hypothetical protein Tco_1544901 [Tanacetum coccineum]